MALIFRWAFPCKETVVAWAPFRPAGGTRPRCFSCLPAATVTLEQSWHLSGHNLATLAEHPMNPGLGYNPLRLLSMAILR